ncbi:Reticulocyte-binding protein homolog 2a [Anthophora quadrimaculata]
MQPGVTVVLATIWLAAYVNVVGTASLHPSRLTLDQYTPLAPQQRQHGVYRRVEGQLDWKDQNPAENQPFDLSISPRRSISVSATDGGSEEQSYKSKYLEKDSMLRRSGNNAGDDFSPLLEDKQFSNFVEEGFTEEKSDAEGTKGQKSVSREPLPPYELENPPIADGTFQDQGPSSVEIYKLDQPREKSPLSSASIAKIVSNSKSKTPKKTNHSNWKDKTTEYKASTSPKILRKQSNSSDDFNTEILSNHDPFSIGGVPELQVGCEGLEASDLNKEKRSIDYSLVKDKSSKDVEPWMAVTPISLDIDYEISGEEGYEEMDELFKLKKLETTTKAVKQNRGDMEPNLHSNFFDDKKPTDKLPVRGDLGKFNVNNQPTIQPVTFSRGNQQSEENVTNSEALHSIDRKEGVESEVKSTDDSVTGTNQRRKILWLDDPDDTEQLVNEGRVKRAIWGFGEDEGVLSSDELQTANTRRRQAYEMRRKEEERRRAEEARRRNYTENQTNSDIKMIREEYEKLLEQRQREEEERQRRVLHQNLQRRPESNKWQQEDEHRQRLQEEVAKKSRWLNEERKRQKFEAHRRKQESRPQIPTYEEEKERRMEEERRLKEEEESRRERARWEQELKRRQQAELDRRNLEERRREWMLKQRQQEEAERRREQEEAERRKQQEEAERRRQQEEAERRRQQEEAERRRQQEDAERRRQQEEVERRRQQEEAERRRQQEEEERRRQQPYKNEPANLLRVRPSTNRPYDPETEQRIREQQEAERRRKLNMYIQRNQPINLNSSRDQQREEMDRRRQQEERKLQEYIRRNQPVRLPKVNESYDRDLLEYRRKVDEARQEEERKLQEYIRRNQPVRLSKVNETYDRNLLEHRRRVDEARQYNRLNYPGSGNGRRNHGPSAPTNIDPRNYVDENRRREAARRLEEERMQERQRQQQEELRREILRREEETRKMQSRRYEEERKKLEAKRLEEERRTKELLEEEARRSQAGRTRPLENSRLGYEDRRRLEEHRRHDTSLIPGNLVLNGSRRAMELQKQRQEQERRRLEAEWRRRANSRTNEGRQSEQHHSGAMEAQWRRQEEARLNALPVSAKIIVKPAVSSSVPKVISRAGFNTDIGFLGVNPNGPGVQVPNFPAPSTRRPPENGPPPCVWAVVQCCSPHVNRLVTCFETMGCPGINWDPNPCRVSITQAAREQVSNFYAEDEKIQRGF